MRIAIDARLNAYRQGGIPQYTARLLRALSAVAPDETFLCIQHRRQQAAFIEAPNVRPYSFWTPPHHRLEGLALGVELLPLRADLLHMPDFIVPRCSPCPAVATFHDLAFVRYPAILDSAAQAYYGQACASARRAAALIAVSESTRRDMAELLAIPPERVHVVHEAAGEQFRPLPGTPGELRVVNGVPLERERFLLCVGTLEPRKNLPMLLQALRICRDRRPDAGYGLVLAGARGWLEQPIMDAIRDLRLADAVYLLGPVHDDDLIWLYAACRIYLNPSRYEGFGLPLLEALACGAPALASNTSSLPEVGGDAACYLPPDDVEAWALALAALWDDDACLAALRQRGPLQAARFSWKRAACETLAVYRAVL